jgi:hypothetical protein
MPVFPFILLPLSAMAMGLLLLVLHLRGIRKPVLIGLHLLLGFGALELMVFLLKGTSDSDGLPAGDFGNVSAGFLALAGFLGLLTPILGRRSRLTANSMLLAHGCAGVAGVLLCMAWVSGL